jgi:very-short-patch-repair endonuclease
VLKPHIEGGESGAVGALVCMAPQIPHDAAVAAIALRQQGNMTRAQLLAAGLTPDAIMHRVRTGRLHPVYRAVYAVGRPPQTPIERASAAVLACGPGAALSHRSALSLWSIDKHWHTPFEVTALRDRRPKGIRTHRPRTIHRRDITVQLGIRTTTLARTVLDMAPRLSEKRRTRIVQDALHSKFMTNSQLANVLQRSPNHRGTPLLIPFLAETKTGVTRSEIEDTWKQLAKDYNLPRFLTNVKLKGGYIADVLFPDHGLIVELDSWEFHSDRISFESNRDRDAENLAHGLPTIRVTHERMKADPAKEADRVRQTLNWLERQRRLPGVPEP